MKKINQDIKNNTYSNIYMVCSDEIYILKDIKNKFINNFNLDEMSVVVYEKDNFNDVEVKNNILAHSFFTDKKLLIFDCVNLSDNKNINELLESMKISFDSNIIVILENEIPKKKKLIEFVKQYGYFLDVKKQPKEILTKFIIKKLNENKLQMSILNVNYLLNRINNNLSVLNNELEKLINYSYGKSIIEKEDIDNIVAETLENKVYKMIEAINLGDMKQVFNYYSDLIALNVKPNDIIFKIRYNYVQILKVKNLIDDGFKTDEMLEKLKLKEKWQLEKIINIARRIEKETILKKIENVVLIDKKRLSGDLDQKIALELMLEINI